MSRNNPNIEQPPTPDDDDSIPVRMPPDQPGRSEEDEPDPPPRGDPPNNEPTRILARHERERRKTLPLPRRAFRIRARRSPFDRIDVESRVGIGILLGFQCR